MKLYNYGRTKNKNVLKKIDMKRESYWFTPSMEKSKVDLKNKIQMLIKRICNSFQISKKELLSKRRLRYIVLPRQILMYILRKEYKLTLERIATLLNKNHATVLHSVNTIENLMSYDSDLKNKVKCLI